MDAMDVLGALLGKKSRGGSAGGNILKDILGGQPQQPTPAPAPTPRRESQRPAQRTSSSRRPASIGDAAKSLEDLLNVSTGRHEQRHPQTRREPEPQAPPQRRYTPPAPAEEDSLNEQSTVLIRAMIAASKADGQINEQEQQKIVGQMGHLSDAEIKFLRTEFAKTVDVRELAWDTPLGMEEQVYSMSLIAIDLDENKEAEYLADLAHGLRLQPRRCNELHRKYNAPEIFRV